MKYLQNKNIKQRELINEVMIILPTLDSMEDQVDEKVVFLEDCSYDIWNLIRNPKSLNEVIEILLQNYSVDEKVLTKDVEDFFEKGISLGIIVNER